MEGTNLRGILIVSPPKEVIQKWKTSDAPFSTQFVNLETVMVGMIILYSISIKSGSKNSLMIHITR